MISVSEKSQLFRSGEHEVQEPRYADGCVTQDHPRCSLSKYALWNVSPQSFMKNEMSKAYRVGPIVNRAFAQVVLTLDSKQSFFFT